MPTLPDGSIHVDQVWKRFRADKTIPLFYDQMHRLGKRFLGRQAQEYRWVLKDVNLEVKPGESLALIGINGGTAGVHQLQFQIIRRAAPAQPKMHRILLGHRTVKDAPRDYKTSARFEIEIHLHGGN